MPGTDASKISRSSTGLLFANGFYEEAVRVVHGVRDRYDGRKRNPYNEIECGNNYARSMAAFSFLPILSGMIFDLPHKTFGFAPREIPGADTFRAFFAVGEAWGTVEEDAGGMRICFAEGGLPADTLALPGFDSVREIRINGEAVPFEFADGVARIEKDYICGAVEILK